MLKKSIYHFISKNRRSVLLSPVEALSKFFLNAVENKNNDHKTNGEFWLMQVLNKYGVSNVFDVGANVGKWTSEANKVFAKAQIYSFEPIPEIFEQLQGSTRKLDHVHSFNLALSDKTGQVEFNYYRKSNLFSSMYVHPEGKDAVKILVNTMTGDEFCRELTIQEIGFLKIDTEGSEPLVLNGFKEMLSKHKIKVIQFEYGLFSIDTKFLLKDYFDLFAQYKYQIGKIYPNHVDFSTYSVEKENFIGPNYLAVCEEETELIRILSN